MHPTDRYTAACRTSCQVILRRYSTSFAAATRLLSRATRPHVAAVYAWSRVGDEVVDGALDAGGDTAEHDRRAAELLAGYRAETDRALEIGHSTNPVVHAFARTALRFGIDRTLTDPFFESMAADLTVTTHDETSLARYVHGSAEVIGEMCLRTFAGGGLEREPGMVAGARALGAAFQHVNFLRDVREDHHELGRDYLPGRDPARLTDRDVAELADRIDLDLALARTALDRIPGRDRLAVLAAHDLFAELNGRLRREGAAAVLAGRVRVPDAVKARIVARAVASGARR